MAAPWRQGLRNCAAELKLSVLTYSEIPSLLVREDVKAALLRHDQSERAREPALDNDMAVALAFDELPVRCCRCRC